MSILRSKIIQYLEAELKYATTEIDLENRRAVIDSMHKWKGECIGLSVLWAYGRHIEDVKTENPEQDNVAFFFNIQNKLINWDGKTEFSLTEKINIERFIGNLILYQLTPTTLFSDSNGAQLNLSYQLEDTKRGSPIQGVAASSIISKPMLKQQLAEVIKPGSMIFVGAASHLTSIYQKMSDASVYFYDSNNEEEIQVRDLDHLVDLFWESTSPQRLDNRMQGVDVIKMELRDLNIKTFRFDDDPIYNYSTQHLQGFTHEKCLNYFLQRKHLIKFIDRSELLLELSSKINFPEIIKQLKMSVQDTELRKTLIALLVFNAGKLSPAVSRYVWNNYQLEIKELLDAKIIHNSIDIEYLQNQTMTIEKSKSTQYFLQLCTEGLIDDTDKNALSLKDVCRILSENPGSIWAQELLEKCDLGYDLSDSISNFGLACQQDLAVFHNLHQGHLEIAQMLLNIPGYRFGVLPNYNSIVNFESKEIAEMMYQNFGTHADYCDNFGNSRLRMLPLIFERKQSYRTFMQKIHNAIEQGDRAAIKMLVNALKIETLNDYKPIKRLFTVDDVFLILSHCSGDLTLTKDLLQSCQKDKYILLDKNYYKTDNNISLNLKAILEGNIDEGHIDVAIFIQHWARENLYLDFPLNTLFLKKNNVTVSCDHNELSRLSAVLQSYVTTGVYSLGFATMVHEYQNNSPEALTAHFFPNDTDARNVWLMGLYKEEITQVLLEGLLTTKEIKNIKINSNYLAPPLLTHYGMQALREKLMTYEQACTLEDRRLDVVFSEYGLIALREGLIDPTYIEYLKYSILKKLLSAPGIEALREKRITLSEAMRLPNAKSLQPYLATPSNSDTVDNETKQKIINTISQHSSYAKDQTQANINAQNLIKGSYILMPSESEEGSFNLYQVQFKHTESMFFAPVKWVEPTEYQVRILNDGNLKLFKNNDPITDDLNNFIDEDLMRNLASLSNNRKSL